MIATNRTAGLLMGTVISIACFSAQAQDGSDRIWSGGTILTMNDDVPRAEAVAEKDGRIIAVGTTEAVMAHKRDGTELIDLGWNRLAEPVSAEAVVSTIRSAIGTTGQTAQPYGDGDAGGKIVAALLAAPNPE